ncbi:MAG: hypothetical protein QGH45_03210, partial [Myxococcota bacterium]|nr:hypothetical protein [Myxococcota bacterium]
MARTQHPCSPGPLAAAGLVGGLAIVAATGALAAEELDDRTYYFGELHAHTGYSADGGSADLGNCQGLMCGNAADFFATLRQAAGLDFGAITDHVNGPSMAPESWETVIGLVDEANDPEGGFVSLLGAEVVIQKLSGTDLGHKNLLFFGDEAALSAIPFEDTAACDSPDLCDDLWACIAGLDDEYGPLLFVPHHPAQLLPMVTKWGCHSERYSPVVEVYSSHGNARDDPAFDPWDTSFWGTDLAYTVNEALAQDHWGYRLGLIGGTDFHDSWPGMVCHLDLLHENQLYGGSITGIVLDADEAFDRMAVYRALKARHTYVTSGPQIPVAFVALDDAGADLAIGGDVTAPPASSQLTLRVSVPDASADYVLSVDLYTSDRVEVPATEVSAGRYELTIDTPAEPFFAYAVVA